MNSTLTSNQQMQARAEASLMNNYGVRDTAIVRGEGSWAWDADGRQYLDFLSGIGVNNIGHCHPAVVEAIQRQAARLIHCANGVLIEPQIELAEILCTNCHVDRVMFANSGAEVTEAAIKLARLWGRLGFGEGKHKIMVFENSFHGRTYGAVSATWSAKVRQDFDPFLPGFVFAKYNDIKDVEEKWEDGVCGVMLETVQGEGGIIPAEKDFLHNLRKLCTERKAALICDEVQCGMGRTGRGMTYLLHDVKPDIVPVAKALGGGVPIGALMANGEFAEVFTKGRHGTTFGGNPLATAAGVAASRVIFDHEFLTEVGRKGCKIWGMLNGLIEKYPEFCDHVRGLGMMLGLQMKKDCVELVKLGRKHGIIVNVTAGNVLRLLPPLTANDEEIEIGIRRIDETIEDFLSQKD